MLGRSVAIAALLVGLTRPAAAAWLPKEAQFSAYGQAVAQLGSARLEEAEAGFRAVLERDPDCGMALHGLGVAQLRQGRTTEAIATLEAAAAKHGGEATVHVALSTARFVAQDFRGARSAAEAAVKLDPEDIEAHAALQQALLRIGDVSAARADLEAARATLPDPVLACFEIQLAAESGAAMDAGRVDTCERAGTSDLVAAAVTRARGGTLDVERVGAMAGDLGAWVVVRLAQAVDRMNAGDTAAAATILDEVVQRYPGRVDARLLRGQLRAVQGDRAGARADLEAAFGGRSWVDVHRSGALSGILRKSDADRLKASMAKGAGLLARLLVEDGDVAGAADLVARARADGADHPGLAAADARVRRARGDAAGAAGALDAALQQWPGDADLLDAASVVVIEEPRAATPRVAAALAASTTWTHPHNLAVSQHKRGDLTGCLATVEGARTTLKGRLTGDAAVRLAHVGLRCAAEAGDLPRARDLLSRAGEVSRISPVTRFNLALLEQQAGNPDAAWRLVRDLAEAPPADNPLLARSVLGLAARVQVAREDWAAAATLGTRADLPAADAWWLGSTLAAKKQDARAKPVLEATCPRLEGDEAARCGALLAEL